MKHRLNGAIALIIIVATIFSGCAKQSAEADSGGTEPDTVVGNIADNDNAVTIAEALSVTGAVTEYDYKAKDMDASWSEAESTIITLSGEAATVKGGGATVNGAIVTITSAGTYVLKGTLNDGQVRVEAASTDDVRLVLNGVTISCGTSAAIYSAQSDKTVIILADGTVNNISDAAEYIYAEGEDEPDAAIFAKDKLAITGTGTLNVTGNFNNGIGTRDDLVITDGTINVTAVNDGLRGRDAVAIKGGNITVSAGSDGIKSNNDTDSSKGYIIIDGGKLDITAGNDAIQAETALTVKAGELTIETGGGSAAAPERQGGKNFGGMQMTFPEGFAMPENGEMPEGFVRPENGEMPEGFTMPENVEMPEGFTMPDTEGTGDMEETETESMKGLKAGTHVLVSGGTFYIDTYDDGVHSNGDIIIAGGEFTILTGDDGVHADNSVTISGGVIDIQKSYEGIEGMTVDIEGGEITIIAADDGINASDGSGSTMAMNRRDGAGMTGDAPVGDERPADENTAANGDIFTRGGKFVANENCRISITGGNIRISSGADGLDSNGNLYIEGGTIEVHSDALGPEDALDADGTVEINGGTVITAGGAGVYHPPAESSSQNVLIVVFESSREAGTTAEIYDSDGNIIAEITAERAFTMLTVSNAELLKGETYDVCLNGEKQCEVTISGTITEISGDGSAYTGAGGGFGGAPQGTRPEGGGRRPGVPQQNTESSEPT